MSISLSTQPSSSHLPQDRIERLTGVLAKHLLSLSPKEISQIALHLSDIADEIEIYQKDVATLSQSFELFEDELIEILADTQVSVNHIVEHGKALSSLLEEALESLP